MTWQERIKTIPREFIPDDPRFGSGPSLIPPHFMKKLADTGVELLGTSHRKPAVKNLVGEVITGIKKYFSVPEDYVVVLGNGGATHLFDMIALGLVAEKAVHFTSGEFSQKWFKASQKVPWITAQEINVPYGQGITPTKQEDADLLCATLNETSTGVMIPQINDWRGENTLVAMDATSGGGQIACDLNLIDCFFFSPQKVMASEGGMWYAILSPRAVARIKALESDSTRYVPTVMDWGKALTNSLKNQTYNTPCVSALFFLNEQLKAMNALGFSQVKEQGIQKAQHLYQWAQEKSYLHPFVSEESYRSYAVATINLSDEYSAEEIAGALRQEGVAYDLEGYRKIGQNQFRFGLFPNVSLENIKKITQIISYLIEG